jgi:hypothetical protein
MDTREIVDAAQVGTGLAVLSGLALAAMVGLLVMRRPRPAPARVKAAVVAGAGAVLYPLWVVYNAIEDHFGLDSVAALLINLALFVVVGVVAGMVVRRFWPCEESVLHRRDAENAEG